MHKATDCTRGRKHDSRAVVAVMTYCTEGITYHAAVPCARRWRSLSAATAALTVWLGSSVRSLSWRLVTGEVLADASQCLIAARSYEWPSLHITGSSISA